MKLPPELIKGFLYFYHDDCTNKDPAYTKVVVARKKIINSWKTLWQKKEVIVFDVYKFNMIAKINDKLTIKSYYKSESCLSLIKQLDSLEG